MVAGILFGWEAALYSIIFQYASTQMVNTLHTRHKKVTLNIMTTKADEIDQKILKATHHGVTRFEGEGCYLKEDKMGRFNLPISNFLFLLCLFHFL